MGRAVKLRIDKEIPMIGTFEEFSEGKFPRDKCVCAEDLSYRIGTDLDKAISLLQELQDKYGEEGYRNLNLDTYVDHEYGDSYVRIDLMGTRKETKVELHDRLCREWETAKLVEKKETEELQRLKKKFEGRR